MATKNLECEENKRRGGGFYRIFNEDAILHVLRAHGGLPGLARRMHVRDTRRDRKNSNGTDAEKTNKARETLTRALGIMNLTLRNDSKFCQEYEGRSADTQPALGAPFPADLLRLSLRFSRRIRSFQADPADGRTPRPASFSSRQMISAFGKFAVFRT